MHGGRLTHEVLLSSFRNSTTDSGVKIDSGAVLVRFNIFGSDRGEPVTDEASAVDTNKGDNASAKLYKRALRTFFVDLLKLPDDRAEPGFEVFDKYLTKARKLPKSEPKYCSKIKDIPWSPRTEALGARIAFLTEDEYAVEWARYYIDTLSISQDPNARLYLVGQLQEIGFLKLQAEHGANRALLGTEAVV